MKKHKSTTPDQANTSNSTAEVFVLPPDLLAKLGINLGNLQNMDVQSPVTNLVKGSDQSIVHGNPTSLPDNRDMSSIIETANLMKESVFLSPTFHQNASNITLEEDISMVNESNDTMPHQNCTKPCPQNNNVKDIQATEQTKFNINNDNVTSNVRMSGNLLDNLKSGYKSITEYQVEHQDGNLVITDTEDTIVTKHQMKTVSSNDEHPDEAYLSDCSNSYSGCSSETLQSEVKNKSTNKIKGDISDEYIILKDIQMSSSNTLFKPVTVDSFITNDESVNDKSIIMSSKQNHEQPLFIPDITNITENTDSSAGIISPGSIISWTPIDKQEKEIRVSKIEYDAYNNSIIHIDNSINAMDLSVETKTVVIDSQFTQTMNSKESCSDTSDDELLSTVKINMNKKAFNKLGREKIETKTSRTRKISETVTHERCIDSTGHEKINEIRPSIPNDERLSNAKLETKQAVHNLNAELRHRDNQIHKSKEMIDNCQNPVSEHSTQISVKNDQLTSECRNALNNYNNSNNMESSKEVKVKIANQYNKKSNNIFLTEMTEVDNTKESNCIISENTKSLGKKVDSNVKAYDVRHANDDKVIYENNKLSSETSGLITQREPNMISEINNVAEDRVKEIAALLSQISERKKQLRNKNKGQEKAAVSKVEPTKSKVIKQGVEKPGGNLVCGKVFKTYQRTVDRKETPALIAISDETLTSDSFQLSINHDQQNKAVQVPTLSSQNEFCVCYDFGSLAYYDCEMLYEHIHFLQRKNIDCDSNILYSIYNDDYIVSESKEVVDFIEDVSQTEHDDTTMADDNICWNNILMENKDNTFGSITCHEKSNINICEQANKSSQAKPLSKVEHKQSLIPSESIEAISLKDVDDIPRRVRNRKRSSVALDKDKGPKQSVNTEGLKRRSNSYYTSAKFDAAHETEIINETPKSAETTKIHSNSKTRGNATITPNKDVLITKKTKMDTPKQNQTASTRRTSNIEIETISQATDYSEDNKEKSVRGASKKSLNLTMDVSSLSHKTAKETDSNLPTTSKPSSTQTDTFISKPHKRSITSGTDLKTPKKKAKKTIGIKEMSKFSKVTKSTDNVPEVVKKSVSMKQLKTNVEDPSATEASETDPTKEIATSQDVTIVDLTDPADEPSAETTTIYIEVEVPAQLSGNLTKCGVCAKTVVAEKWIEHISKEHNYLAWRDGEQPLDFKSARALREHLLNIVKRTEKLICTYCGLVRRFAKPFLRHITNCKDGKNPLIANLDFSIEQDDDDAPLSSVMSESTRGKRKSAVLPPVTCGVCQQTVEQSSWIEHIRNEHKYLAWSSDETPLNVDDEDEVKRHLNYISKYHGGLQCTKCDSKWNYPKKYLLHVKLCDGGAHNQVRSKTIEVEIPSVVTCGVCKLQVNGNEWIKHIMQAHQYMAWIDGEEPIDTENPEQVRQHLYKILKMAGELICMKCGVSRKYERLYRQHIAACSITDFDPSIYEASALDKDEFECAICHEKGSQRKWKNHAMTKHYNIAWRIGEIPINLKNPYAVEKYLKEYQRKYVSLVCKVCKSSRTSCYGFYAHIMTCGKSDQELEAVHDVCDICKKKYLCIYKNQHVAMHREQVFNKERKELKAKKAEEEAQLQKEMQHEQLLGKRRAAQKAKKVIQTHSSNVVDGKQVCSCGKIFENEAEVSQHYCKQQRRGEDDAASDLSVKMEPTSGAESADSDLEIESDDEPEEDTVTKKRVRVYESTTKITRMSYRVHNYLSYLVKGFKNFCELHYSAESLFTQWPVSANKELSSSEWAKYLPPLTESCKVRFDQDSTDWTTYKRFEAKKCKGYSLFTGGAIQCMSWAPPNLSDETLGHYLAVSTHRAPDVPRLSPHDLPRHPALLQIWDCQQFNFHPRLALGLAHEFGVVWAMDWCPSGGRDAIPSEFSDHFSKYRLGLLAVACSDGNAYILSVPYPSLNPDSGMVVYKVKPVAELRLSMSSERRAYQATSISWSHQKGHNIIIVGYSDGSTALYDLNTESPFLKTTENGTAVYFPFHDKRSENSAITGVGICPTSSESYCVGGYCSTSITGGSLAGWPRAAPSVRCHLAISGAHYSPHWPAVLLSGDAPFTVKSVNEMEWWGGGRRLGAARATAACARCGRVCAAAAPAVRLLRAHPCYPEVKKQLVATILMVPFNQPRKRKVNDDLSIVVEPLNYEDAIAKYGLQLTLVAKTEQAEAQKICNENELRPELFPLSDVVAAAFCPSARFHDKVALATHAGLIFIING